MFMTHVVNGGDDWDGEGGGGAKRMGQLVSLYVKAGIFVKPLSKLRHMGGIQI